MNTVGLSNTVGKIGNPELKIRLLIPCLAQSRYSINSEGTMMQKRIKCIYLKHDVETKGNSIFI